MQKDLQMFDQSINGVIQRSYSLYVLPIVGVLTMIALSIGGRFLSSDEDFLEHFWRFGLSENLLMILNIGLKMGVKFAIILMCAYHFRINVASFKNILITVVMVVICEFVISIISSFFFQFLSGFDILFLIYMSIGVVNLLIQCAVYTLGFILVFKNAGSAFDIFEGSARKSPQYWRIANLMTLFFMIHLMSSIMMSLYMAVGFNTIVLGNLGLMLLINALVVLPLFVLVFSKKLNLQRLEIGTILRTGRFLGFWIVILLIVCELLINYLDSGTSIGGFIVLGLSLFAVYVVLIVTITFVTVKNRFGE